VSCRRCGKGRGVRALAPDSLACFQTNERRRNPLTLDRANTKALATLSQTARILHRPHHHFTSSRVAPPSPPSRAVNQLPPRHPRAPFRYPGNFPHTTHMAVRRDHRGRAHLSHTRSRVMQQPPSQPRAYSQAAYGQPNGLPQASGPVPGARPLDPNQGRVQQIGHARVLCIADVRGTDN
jgi:hypothetical protein